MSSARSETVAGVPIPADEHAAGRRWLLPVLLTGQALAAMDTAIANVAAPALHDDLGISGPLLQMAVAGYGLAYAVFLITGARLGDDYGYRRLFMLGVGLFSGASLLCGLSPNTEWLIAGRVAQGLGAALLVPQVLSLIQRSFDGPARTRAIGYYSMVLGLGATAGQVLGGVAVTLDLWGMSWRPAFLINVPVGILLILGAPRVLPDVKGDARRALDVAGIPVLTACMLLLVVPLTFGQDAGWPAWTWSSLAMGLAGMALFWRYERALAGRGGSPLLNAEVLLTPGIRPGLFVVILGFVGYGGWLFATALYLQTGLGYSPLISGAVFAAYALGFGVSNISWSKLPARHLHWTPPVGLAVMVLANLLFALTALNAGWSAPVMLPLLFLAGGSHGLTFGTTVNQISHRTARANLPALSGLVTTSVQLSIVMGIAALGALYLAAAGDGGAAAASLGMTRVTLLIAAGAVIALGCSLRLASLPVLRPDEVPPVPSVSPSIPAPVETAMPRQNTAPVEVNASSDIADHVRSLLSRILSVAPAEIEDHRPLAEYGLTSIDLIDVVSELESRYRIEFDPASMVDLTCGSLTSNVLTARQVA